MENGVRLVSHGPQAFDQAPILTVDSTPIAVLGGVSGDPAFELSHAYQVTLLSDNRYAVLPIIGPRILVFGADGKSEKSYGGLG